MTGPYDQCALERLAGITLALAGLLQVAGSALHPNDTAATRYFFDPRWAPAHVILALSFLLLIFGLMGWYTRFAAKLGALGFVGFVLAVTGSALLVGVTFAEAFLLPVIAASQPPTPLASWLDPTGPLAGAVAVSVVALLGFDLGFVVLGVTADCARVVSRPTGLVLALATVLTNGEFFGPLGFAVYVGSGVVLGLTLAWWGWTLIALNRRWQ
jgi:hypothetical protein